VVVLRIIVRAVGSDETAWVESQYHHLPAGLPWENFSVLVFLLCLEGIAVLYFIGLG
jgi:hypothetical protein